MTTCVQRSERGIGDHHCSQTEWAVVIYGLDHNVDRGKVKGLKMAHSLALTGPFAGEEADTVVFSAFGYGAVEESGGRNRTLSCSVRLTRTAAKKQRLTQRQQKQAGEESWLK